MFAFLFFLDGACQVLPCTVTPDAGACGNGDEETCQIEDELASGRLVALPNLVCGVSEGMVAPWLVEGTKFSA